MELTLDFASEMCRHGQAMNTFTGFTANDGVHLQALWKSREGDLSLDGSLSSSSSPQIR
jgi:hypothetical protein